MSSGLRNFLWTLLYFSTKYVIFVRWFLIRNIVFGTGFCTLQEPLAYPLRKETAGWSEWEKRVVSAIQQPGDRNKEMRVLPTNGTIRYCGLLSAFSPTKMLVLSAC